MLATHESSNPGSFPSKCRHHAFKPHKRRKGLVTRAVTLTQSGKGLPTVARPPADSPSSPGCRARPRAGRSYPRKSFPTACHHANSPKPVNGSTPYLVLKFRVKRNQGYYQSSPWGFWGTPSTSEDGLSKGSLSKAKQDGNAVG